MTEEERKARQEYLEDERHKRRLRAYHDEAQNLMYAVAWLIKCIAFYIVAKGVEVLWGASLKHKKLSMGIPN